MSYDAISSSINVKAKPHSIEKLQAAIQYILSIVFLSTLFLICVDYITALRETVIVCRIYDKLVPKLEAHLKGAITFPAIISVNNDHGMLRIDSI